MMLKTLSYHSTKAFTFPDFSRLNEDEDDLKKRKDICDREEKILIELQACTSREACVSTLRKALDLPIKRETEKEFLAEFDFGDRREVCPSCGHSNHYALDGKRAAFVECPNCSYVEDAAFEPWYQGVSEEEESFEMSISEEDDKEKSGILFSDLVFEDPFEGVSAIDMAHILITKYDYDETPLLETLSRFGNQESDCDCSPSFGSYELGLCMGGYDARTGLDQDECTAHPSCIGCHGTCLCPDCGGWGTIASWTQAKRDY